jgi:hypothetical protein
VVGPLAQEEMRGSELDDELVVQDVAGAAERTGIRPGDVISISVSPLRTVATPSAFFRGRDYVLPPLR